MSTGWFEKIFGIKQNMTGKLLFSFCIILFSVMSFWLLKKFAKTQGEKIERRWNESEFSGIVHNIQSDYSNHGTTSITLKNGVKINNLPGSYYYQFKKEDSIFKIKSNDAIYIKRGKLIIKVE